MAGFMKNAMSYLGMSDVVDDEDDYIEEDEEQKPASKSAFDSDHTVTPLASTTAPAASSTTKPFPGGRVNRITTIHPKSYEDAQLVGRALFSSFRIRRYIGIRPTPSKESADSYCAPSKLFMRGC